MLVAHFADVVDVFLVVVVGVVVVAALNVSAFVSVFGSFVESDSQSSGSMVDGIGGCDG